MESVFGIQKMGGWRCVESENQSVVQNVANLNGKKIRIEDCAGNVIENF